MALKLFLEIKEWQRNPKPRRKRLLHHLVLLQHQVHRRLNLIVIPMVLLKTKMRSQPVAPLSKKSPMSLQRKKCGLITMLLNWSKRMDRSLTSTVLIPSLPCLCRLRLPRPWQHSTSPRWRRSSRNPYPRFSPGRILLERQRQVRERWAEERRTEGWSEATAAASKCATMRSSPILLRRNN